MAPTRTRGPKATSSLLRLSLYLSRLSIPVATLLAHVFVARQGIYLFLNPEILFCLYSLVGNRITCFLCLPQLRPRRLSSATLYIMALMSMIPSPRRWVVLLSLSLAPTLVAAVNPATSTKAAAADYYVRDLPGLPADGPKVNMHAG